MSDTELPPCPKCKSAYTYEDGALYVCPECAHEWSGQSQGGGHTEDAGDVVKDSLGNILKDGDSVALVRDLDVKGAAMNLKRGTVAKNIRLTRKPEEVECRFGKSTIVLRTEYLKKS